MGGHVPVGRSEEVGKFLVIYNSPIPAAEMMASATPEQMEAGMAAWMEWAQRNGDSVVDLGVPLGSNRRVGLRLGRSDPGERLFDP
jgi:hypothetical protein